MTTFSIRTTHIPPELRERAQWVVWRYETRPDKDGNPKQTKVPYTPGSGLKRLAESDNPATWRSYQDALDDHLIDIGDGIGFMFSKDDPYFGIDIDKAVQDDGTLTSDAAAIIATMQTYTEQSPSGRGIHIIGRGKLPPGRRRRGSLEMYDVKRYFTMTGHVWEKYDQIAERQDALNFVHQTYLQQDDAHDEPASEPINETPRASTTTDDQLLQRMFAAKNGARIQALWNGDTTGYDSQSEADMALCNHLAFWTGKDAARMDLLFRQSGLMRDKWDERHYGDGATYGQFTINKAIARTREVYMGGFKTYTYTPHNASANGNGTNGHAHVDPETGEIHGGAQTTQDDIKGLIASILADKSLSIAARAAEVGRIIVIDMRQRGEFYYRADDPDFQYFFDNEKKVVRPLGLRAKDEAWLRHFIAEQYAVLSSSSAFPYIHDCLTHYCAYSGKAVIMRQFSWFDRAKHLLYVYNNAGRMYRLDGGSIAILDNGDDGVMFEDLHYAPFEAVFDGTQDLLHDHIYTLPNYSTDNVLSDVQQRLLLVLWTLAPFFDNLFQSRPILLIYGGSGGGKSTVLRAYTRLVLGPDHNLAPVPRDEKAYDEIVLANRLICFDNADSYYKYLPDKLAVTATGYEVPLRQLYTTAKVVRFPVRCWIAMTSRDQYFAREDVTSRMLILHTQQMTTKVPEKELMDAIDDHRNAMWGELLTALNQVVGLLKTPASYHGAFRMADFAWFGFNAAQVWGAVDEFKQALDALSYDQNELAMEGNPLFDVLNLWMTNAANIGRSVSAIALHKELSELAKDQYGPRCEYFDYCKSANWLGRRIRQNMRALAQYYVIAEDKDPHTKKVQYRFKPKD